jgi:hypothetical protein
MDKVFGMAGWRQFLQNRRDILCEVDKLLEQTSNRPIRTAHGEAGEAKVREWLSEFLPKKYAVTSGYIIPNIYEDQGMQYHFDVIVYDVLEAPVLWIEGNEDQSDQGKSKAIPAKYVKAVYEVKARITLRSTRDAIEKLEQLNTFKGQLGTNFNCALIFIDLIDKDVNRQSIMSALVKGSQVHGCWGGTILRCNLDDSATALIGYFQSDPTETRENNKTPLMIPIDDVKVLALEDGNIQLKGGGGVSLISNGVDSWFVTKHYFKIHYDSSVGVNLSWSRSGFADFSMEVLSALDGITRRESNDKRLTFGKVFDTLEKEEAKKQSEEKIESLPFLEVALGKIEGTESYLAIKQLNSDKWEVKLDFSVTNTGDTDAEVSGDKFKTSAILAPDKTGVSSQTIGMEKLKKQSSEEFKKGVEDYIKSKVPLCFTKRFVYRTTKEENKSEFYSIALKFEVYVDRYTMDIL